MIIKNDIQAKAVYEVAEKLEDVIKRLKELEAMGFKDLRNYVTRVDELLQELDYFYAEWEVTKTNQ